MGQWAGGVRGAEDRLVTPPSVENACLLYESSTRKSRRPEWLFDVSGYHRTVGTQAGTAEALIVEQSRKAGLWFPPASSEPSVSNRWFALRAHKIADFSSISCPASPSHIDTTLEIAYFWDAEVIRWEAKRSGTAV